MNFQAFTVTYDSYVRIQFNKYEIVNGHNNAVYEYMIVLRRDMNRIMNSSAVS